MSVKKVGYYRNYYGNKDRKGALDEEIWADFHKQQEEEEKKKFSSDEMISFHSSFALMFDVYDNKCVRSPRFNFLTLLHISTLAKSGIITVGGNV